MFPAIVRDGIEGDIHERPPLRSLWFADEMHSSLYRRAVRFASVARNTGADDVFPIRQAAVIARNDVVEIQLAPVKTLRAILASVPVALEDVVPGELYFLVW